MVESPSSAKKVELVGQLKSAVDGLAASFKAIELSSANLASNVSKATGSMGASGGTAALSAADAMSGVLPSVVPTPAGASGPVTNWLSGLVATNSAIAGILTGTRSNRLADSMAATAELFGGRTVGSQLGQGFLGGAMIASPSLTDALTMQNVLQRQRFFGYEPTYGYNQSPGDMFNSLAKNGLPTSPMDPLIAANVAASMGMMPAQGSYSTFMNSAATISALAPGAGITGGVQAASALNQGRSVNMLRMIGINARDIGSNKVNSITDVVNQLWTILTNANNGAAPNKNDLANSLLPGNALDSMLNQYFDDPILRNAVVSALFQKASGGDLSIGSMTAGTKGRSQFGPLASGVLGEAKYNTSILDAQTKMNPYIIAGLNAANAAGGGLADMASSGLAGNALGQNFISTSTFIDAFAGLGGGAGAYALQGFLGAGDILGGTAGAGAQNLLQKLPFFKNSNLLKFIGGVLPGLGGAAGQAAALGSLGGFGADSGNLAPFESGKATGPVIKPAVYVSMPGASYMDGHQAGLAVANAMSRSRIRGALYA